MKTEKSADITSVLLEMSLMCNRLVKLHGELDESAAWRQRQSVRQIHSTLTELAERLTALSQASHEGLPLDVNGEVKTGP